MGGVSVEGGGGGKRAVDTEINMVPMIDLLMCLICFLLITAVWSTMARINADAQVPGPPDPNKEVTKNKERVTLHLYIKNESNFKGEWKEGSATVQDFKVEEAPTKLGSVYRYPKLGKTIAEQWQKQPKTHKEGKEIDQAVLHCDNKTPYKIIVAAIDAIYTPKRAFPGGGNKKYPALNVAFSAK